MPTAKLLTDRPLVRFNEDGLRVLWEPCAVDLGVYIAELHAVEMVRAETSAEGTTILRVPVGFVYDGASIPKLSQYLVGDKETWELAGLFHDALYRWQAPRGAADRVFWIIARSGSKRVGPVRGWLGYAGLRLFGGLAYRRNGARSKA